MQSDQCSLDLCFAGEIAVALLTSLRLRLLDIWECLRCNGAATVKRYQITAPPVVAHECGGICCRFVHCIALHCITQREHGSLVLTKASSTRLRIAPVLADLVDAVHLSHLSLPRIKRVPVCRKACVVQSGGDGSGGSKQSTRTGRDQSNLSEVTLF